MKIEEYVNYNSKEEWKAMGDYFLTNLKESTIV